MVVVPMLAALATAGAPAPAAAQPAPIAVRVDAIVQPDGSLGAGGWIVVRNGRIDSIGPSAPPPGAATFEIEGGVACAGFVDVATSLGADDPLVEPARAFTPEVAAADAFAADHSSFRDAARSGVTTVGLMPAGDNVVAGRVAIVRTRDEHGRGAQLVGHGPLRFTLADRAFPRDRTPTSRMGALPELRQLVASDAMKSGGLSFVAADTPDEVRIAVELFRAAGRPLALLQPRRPEDALELLAGAVEGAVLGPFDLDTGERDVRVAKLLAERDVPFAFTAGGDGGALRLTAAVAVRDGLDAALARRALTSVPARLLGVENEAGALAAGKRADLVVFGGDPLDLSAPVRLVLAGGARVELKEKP